jgi:hypothetical protein
MTASFTEEEINAAFDRVEEAKQRHPHGFRFLETFALRPATSFVAWAYVNADARADRLAREDRRTIFVAAWLNGLAVGIALAESAPYPNRPRPFRRGGFLWTLVRHPRWIAYWLRKRPFVARWKVAYWKWRYNRRAS